jgi:hypothetical protein
MMYDFPDMKQQAVLIQVFKIVKSRMSIDWTVFITHITLFIDIVPSASRMTRS